jgi:alpha(1,3/1,4) fucosyltransferase
MRQSPGYVTEKLFHAKAAGCVPIYWGAPDVELDFLHGWGD